MGKKSDGGITYFDHRGTSVARRAVQVLGDINRLTHVFPMGNGAFACFLNASEVSSLRAHREISAVTKNRRIRWLNDGKDRINQRRLPLDSDSGLPNVGNGAGVHVYIIDTGILGTHTEFAGRTSTGFSAFSGTNEWLDSRNHGTHVAGIAVGATYGVAPGATIHSVRIAPSGSGSASDAEVIAAANWIRDNHEMPAVVNCSFGMSSLQVTEDAFQELLDRRIPIVASAGNSFLNMQDFPADLNDGIAVGAIEFTTTVPLQDTLAFFSNYGTQVDVYAPGYNITSADSTSNNASRQDSGTSMAAPFVTGAVALYLQYHPNDTAREVRNAIVVNATRDAISLPGARTGHLLYLSPNWILPNRIIADPQDPNSPTGGVLVNADVLHPNGKYYDQVLMTDREVTVHADPGQITRVSWIDENFDIVMAELTGPGANLRVSLDDYVAPQSYASLYNQPRVSNVGG